MPTASTRRDRPRRGLVAAREVLAEEPISSDRERDGDRRAEPPESSRYGSLADVTLASCDPPARAHPAERPLGVLAQQRRRRPRGRLDGARARAPPRSRARRARSGAGSAGRCAARRAARAARSSSPSASSQSTSDTSAPPARERLAGPALLDPAVPRADVLADVAAVDRASSGARYGSGIARRRLRPVGEAAGRVERPRLVERAGRAGLDAERAGAAVGVERRRRLDLGVRDERPEHDPGAVAARDQERVLAVEADAGRAAASRSTCWFSSTSTR